MKVTYNYDQIAYLHSFIAQALTRFPFDSRREKLLDLLVNSIRIKLRNKLDRRRPTYSITLSETEAIALEEWAAVMVPKVPPDNFIYEINLLRQLVNESNRLYCAGLKA